MTLPYLMSVNSPWFVVNVEGFACGRLQTNELVLYYGVYSTRDRNHHLVFSSRLGFVFITYLYSDCEIIGDEWK